MTMIGTLKHETMDELITTSPSSPSAAIALEGLVVKYGDKVAVDGLSLQVPIGSVFGFLGPNGSGKTTTIKALLGFRSPDAGSAKVLGYDVVTNSLEIRTRTGYVSELNSLYDYLTIPQVCNFCRDTNRRWNQGIVDRYIRMFDLPSKSKVGQLSKGMKSQLALSVALGSEPDLLILDEPTSGLDPIARRQFLGTLIREVAAEGKTIFFSSHILSEVEGVADHVGIINKGKLVVSDDLDDLKQKHKMLRLLYADTPTTGDVTALQILPGVQRIEQEGRSIRIEAKGDIDGLVQAIQATFPAPRDIDVTNLNLEDLFLEYMKEDREDREDREDGNDR